MSHDREKSPGAPEAQISPQAPKSEPLPKRFFSGTHPKGPICTGNLRISRTHLLGIPFLVSGDHGIEDRQQFSHRGDDGGHFGFSSLQESLVEVSNSRVKSYGTEGGHKESGPQVPSPSARHAFASVGSTVTIDRCDPNQGRDLTAIQLAQLGQFGHQEGGGGFANGRGGHELLGLLFEFRHAVNVLTDLLLDLLHLFFEGLEDGSMTSAAS